MDDKAKLDFDPAVLDAVALAAAERETQWPTWPMLQKMLPGLRRLHEAEVQTLEEALSRLQAKEEELAATVAKEEELVAARDAALRALAERGRSWLRRMRSLRPYARVCRVMRACHPPDLSISELPYSSIILYHDINGAHHD